MENVIQDVTPKKVNVKDQLKNADDQTALKIVSDILERVRRPHIEKWKHDVVGVLTQKKPIVNGTTRQTYQALIYDICEITKKVNPDIFKKARDFARNNGLNWRRPQQTQTV